MTDQEIFDGLKKGDRKTLEYIYHNFYSKVLGRIIGNGGIRQDGEDIFSQTLMGILKSIQDGRYEPRGLFEPYFWNGVKMNWQTELRRRKRKPITGDESGAWSLQKKEATVLEKIIEDEEKQKLYQAIKQLGEPCYSWLQRVYIDKENISIHELADEENVDDNTMRQRLHRCREKLKELLKGY